jgi:hypothetical protein
MEEGVTEEEVTGVMVVVGTTVTEEEATEEVMGDTAEVEVTAEVEEVTEWILR